MLNVRLQGRTAGKTRKNLENFIVWKFSQREEILKTEKKQSAKV
jgi:hypothetical protein